MYDLIFVLAMFISIIVLLFITQKAVKRFNLLAEHSRKAVHIIMGVTVTLFPFIFEYKISVWILATLSIALFYIIRHYKKVKDSLGDAMYRIERVSYGEIYYTLGVALSFTLAPSNQAYIVSIFILTFSDSLASLIGIKYGKYIISIKGNSKSLAGSFTFFISTFLISFIATQSFLFSLSLSFLLTFVETLSIRGIDNLLIPLISSIFFIVFTPLSDNIMIIFTIIFFLALVVVFRYFHTYTISKTNSEISIHKNSKELASCKIYNNTYFGSLQAQNESSLTRLLKIIKKDYPLLVGPLDGSTWKSYRLVIKSDDTPPFLFEPQNKSFFKKVFEDEGFKIEHEYYSTMANIDDVYDARLEKVKLRLEKNGILIRSINSDDFENEIKNVYTLSCKLFKNNPYYSHISEEEFLKLYMPFKSVLPPQLCQLMFLDSKLIGFMFAFIDKEQVVMKSVAIEKTKITAGASLVLISKIADFAKKHNYKTIIYALMHKDNHSSKIAKKHGKVFREYALYRWSNL